MQERKFNILELQKYREQWDIVCTDMMSTEEIEIFNLEVRATGHASGSLRRRKRRTLGCGSELGGGRDTEVCGERQ